MTAKYAVMEINSTCELLKAQCSVTQKRKFLSIMSKRTFWVLKKKIIIERHSQVVYHLLKLWQLINNWSSEWGWPQMPRFKLEILLVFEWDQCLKVLYQCHPIQVLSNPPSPIWKLQPDLKLLTLRSDQQLTSLLNLTILPTQKVRRMDKPIRWRASSWYTK